MRQRERKRQREREGDRRREGDKDGSVCEEGREEETEGGQEAIRKFGVINSKLLA